MLLKRIQLYPLLSTCCFSAAILFIVITLSFSGIPMRVETPIVLMVACLGLLIPCSSMPALATLQKITTFFLLAVCIDETRTMVFSIPLTAITIKISYSIIVLALCALGFLFNRTHHTSNPKHRENLLHQAWALTFAIVIVHMLFLYGVLKYTYGYGYEQDIHVLGSICLYFFLFYLFWPQLQNSVLRRITGLALGITLFICI